MLKEADPLKQAEARAAEVLRRVIGEVPVFTNVELRYGAQASPDRGADLVAHVEAFGKRHVLVCEVKSNGQPRHVRMGLLQLRSFLNQYGEDAVPVFMAPYLSPHAQALCREQGVGFLDFEGNVRLAFDGVFIDRQVASRPATEKRELRSIFKPKSAQVLRVLLREPSRPWRVTDLAQVAGVSLGHVSNVRKGLLDREWAQASKDGLQLSEPDALLDAWRDGYEPPNASRQGFYTTLHGSALDDVARRVLRKDGTAGLAVYASFSAAQWLAPFGRTGMHNFYADQQGLALLQSTLKLSVSSKGENVVVSVLEDDALFRDAVEAAPGAFCTSPVQTYLDLTHAGERGREAADHLRRERLKWPK